MLLEHLEHDLVGGADVRPIDLRLFDAGVDLDGRDGEEPEALVVDPLDLLGDDLADHLVEPSGARVATGAGLSSSGHGGSLPQDPVVPTRVPRRSDGVSDATSGPVRDPVA